jgi:hypothetical protein
MRMPVRMDGSALRDSKLSQYTLRFLFGGIVTAIAGLVAQRHGPVVAGLLLAFPAIFPASATLIEKHEKQQKEKNGMSGTSGEGRWPAWMLPALPWEAWAFSCSP